MRRCRWYWPVVAVAGVLLAGCGNDAVPAADGSPSPSVTPSPTASPTPGPLAGFAPASECEPFVPAELPSGAAPGEARPHPPEEPRRHRAAWGEGRDQISAGWGREVLEEAGTTDPFPVSHPDKHTRTVDGVDYYVNPTGDQPMGMMGIRFLIDDCYYAISMTGGEWAPDGEIIRRGYYAEEALEYVERF